MFFYFILLFLVEQTRKRAFTLIAQAYSSISGDDFAKLVGLPVNEAVDGTAINYNLTEHIKVSKQNF